MDERLEKALNFSNYMITLNNQKRLIKEKYNEDLVYFFNGCQFTISKELINFCSSMSAAGQDNLVLIDDNGIPTQIEDLNTFHENILDQYFAASNTYFTEYSNLKKNRSVEKLVDYEQE